MLHEWAATLHHRVRRLAGEHPLLFYPLHRLRQGRGSSLAVGPGTELVIEGYPRSANGFAVEAFLAAQPRQVRLAHHLHVPAQVIRAAAYGVPMLVLLREPEAAVRSFLVRYPHVAPAEALRSYLSFYRTVRRRREAVVLATFEAVVADYGRVIGAVNARFGTDFVPPQPDDRARKAVAERLEARLRARRGSVLTGYLPHPIREAAKRRVDLSGEEALMAACWALYRELVAGAGAAAPDRPAGDHQDPRA